MAVRTESRRKLHELLDLLREADERRYGPEFGVETPDDIADGHRNLLHLLSSGLHSHMESDPERPKLRRIVSPTRKFRGDNADAIYFEAPIRPDREYVLEGNMAGAVYVSLTVEEGAGEGSYTTGTAAGLHDGEFDVDAEGNFRILLSAKEQPRNWLRLSPEACRLTTRHYFEDEVCAAADPARHVPLRIDPVVDPGPPPRWDDAASAKAIQRVINFVRGDTVGAPQRDPQEMPAFVSTTPNRFNPPAKPGNLAFAAMDIAYAQTVYQLGPEEALVMTGRFPTCRFANVTLWNRYLMSYDYNDRRVSLNRAQTRLEPDGSYRMVIAHRNPGVSQLDRHRGARERLDLLALPAARGRGRDAAGAGGALLGDRRSVDRRSVGHRRRPTRRSAATGACQRRVVRRRRPQARALRSTRRARRASIASSCELRSPTRHRSAPSRPRSLAPFTRRPHDRDRQGPRSSRDCHDAVELAVASPSIDQACAPDIPRMGAAAPLAEAGVSSQRAREAPYSARGRTISPMRAAPSPAAVPAFTRPAMP